MAFPSSTALTLANTLSTTHNLPASPAWVSRFLSSQKSTTPLPSLTATARIRLLNANIIGTLSPSTSSGFLPADLTNPNRHESRFPGPVIVQVLALEDLTRSKWEQVEALEAEARGEGKKGMEIVRVVREEGGEEEGAGGADGGRGMWKLLVEDAQGGRAWAVELASVKGVGQGMSVGCKLLLKNALVARGVVLMDPGSTMVLGGKIEEAHKKWLETRLEQLKQAATIERQK